jgi:bifunctional UDP-N-acetylglucosamine pyrophosphorylase/glucosamine-1-phosphate N-acetyltransferase
VVPEQEVHGINDRAQLAAAEGMMQDRLRRAAMMSGVTLVAPETVFLSHDTRLGRDVVVEPHVVFGLGVTVEEGAVVHGFSHLEGARIAPGASVGPFARLRPGASIGQLRGDQEHGPRGRREGEPPDLSRRRQRGA